MSIDKLFVKNGLELDLLNYYSFSQYAKDSDLERVRSLYLQKHNLTEKEFFNKYIEFENKLNYNSIGKK